MPKISILQLSILTMICVNFTSHFFVTPVILSGSGRDAWLAILFNIVPYILWICLLFIIVKRSNQQHIFVWLKSSYGSFVAWIVTIVSSFYLFGVAFFVLKFLMLSMNAYFPETPLIVFLFFSLLLNYFASKSGMQSIAIIAGFVFPFVIILYLFLFMINFPEKDFSRLLPLFEYDLGPIWNGMFISGVGLMGIMVVIWMQHHLASKIRLWHLMLLGAVILVVAFDSVSSSIAEFGSTEAAKQINPYLEQWQIVHIGTYLDHVDFLYAFLWLSGAYILISTAIYLLQELYTEGKKKPSPTFVFFIYALLFLCDFIPMTPSQFVFITTHYYFPIVFAFFIALSLCLCILSLVKKQRSEPT